MLAVDTGLDDHHPRTAADVDELEFGGVGLGVGDERRHGVREAGAIAMGVEVADPALKVAAVVQRHGPAQRALDQALDIDGIAPVQILVALGDELRAVIADHHKQRPILQETLATATQPRYEA